MCAEMVDHLQITTALLLELHLSPPPSTQECVPLRRTKHPSIVVESHRGCHPCLDKTEGATLRRTRLSCLPSADKTEGQTTKGPMWGYPRPVLGAVDPFLEPFRGRLSPNIDNVSEQMTLRYPHEGPWVAEALCRGSRFHGLNPKPSTLSPKPT